MSYEILYARQFIKLSNGDVVPEILSGSNNCYDVRQNCLGRTIETRERNWWPLFNGKTINENNLDDFIHEDKNRNYEWFLSGGKWILNNQMKKWLLSGIKKSKKYRGN